MPDMVKADRLLAPHQRVALRTFTVGAQRSWNISTDLSTSEFCMVGQAGRVCLYTVVMLTQR